MKSILYLNECVNLIYHIYYQCPPWGGTLSHCILSVIRVLKKNLEQTFIQLTYKWLGLYSVLLCRDRDGDVRLTVPQFPLCTLNTLQVILTINFLLCLVNIKNKLITVIQINVQTYFVLLIKIKINCYKFYSVISVLPKRIFHRIVIILESETDES